MKIRLSCLLAAASGITVERHTFDKLDTGHETQF
jgi:hypothetical protein